MFEYKLKSAKVVCQQLLLIKLFNVVFVSLRELPAGREISQTKVLEEPPLQPPPMPPMLTEGVYMSQKQPSLPHPPGLEPVTLPVAHTCEPPPPGTVPPPPPPRQRFDIIIFLRIVDLTSWLLLVSG